MAGGVAHVDAVQAEQRIARREALGRHAIGPAERLHQGLLGEQVVGAQAPVVEVPGDYHRRLRGDGRQQVAEQAELLLPVRLAQAQVHADGMHLAVAGDVQHAMQQAALLVAAHRDVEVVVLDDGKLRQQRIAVVAVGVDRIAAIGELRPHAVGEELVVRRRRPVPVALGVAVMVAQHFLEEYQVGFGGTHRVSQLRQDETPVQGGEALVGIDGEHLQPMHRGDPVDDDLGRGNGGHGLAPAHLAHGPSLSVCPAWPSALGGKARRRLWRGPAALRPGSLPRCRYPRRRLAASAVAAPL
ncbi:hypothetical protein D9M71_505910 [compost metagenome]